MRPRPDPDHASLEGGRYGYIDTYHAGGEAMPNAGTMMFYTVLVLFVVLIGTAWV